MRVLVTGAAGQLGQTIVRCFARDHEVVAMSRGDLDITRHDDVQRAVADAAPGAIVNCAAWNDVDGAEDHAAAAIAVNALGVRSLARAAAAAGAVLVHYSTDFVFDGHAREPYAESAPPAPRSVYGQSKLLGEWFAADAPRHYVLRVASLFGGERPRSSVDRIVDALRQGRPARVFTDRVVSPSYVVDVAEATARLLAGGTAPGLYHCVNSGYGTWLEVGLEIARLLNAGSLLEPVTAASADLRAKRPAFAALSNQRLARAGVPMPSWQDALVRCLGRVSS